MDPSDVSEVASRSDPCRVKTYFVAVERKSLIKENSNMKQIKGHKEYILLLRIEVINYER